MLGIAKAIKFLIALAALVTSVEAVVRLAKLAWSLVLTLKKVLSANPNAFRRFSFAR